MGHKFGTWKVRRLNWTLVRFALCSRYNMFKKNLSITSLKVQQLMILKNPIWRSNEHKTKWNNRKQELFRRVLQERRKRELSSLYHLRGFLHRRGWWKTKNSTQGQKYRHFSFEYLFIFIFHCLYPFLIYSVSYNDWAFEPITDFNWIIVANVLFSGRLNYIFALNWEDQH